MAYLIDQFKKSADEVRLSDGVASRMRARLVAYIHAHPVPSPYQRFLGILSPFAFLARTPVIAVPLIFLVAFGAASAYAASGALPGDILYPMKTNLIEPMRGLFALSDEAKAAWKVELAEERLAELEELAAKGKLISEEAAKSRERLTNSLQVAQDTIQRLSEKNPDAAARLESRKEEINSKVRGVATTTKKSNEQENGRNSQGPVPKR